jgi:hypothetical protein
MPEFFSRLFLTCGTSTGISGIEKLECVEIPGSACSTRREHIRGTSVRGFEKKSYWLPARGCQGPSKAGQGREISSIPLPV